MTSAVVLPLWALLLLVAATPLAGWWGARRGARDAIALCSAHWGCEMMRAGKREEWQSELAAQHKKAAESHPELSQIRDAQKLALSETGDHVAIPERPRVRKPSGE